MSDREWRDATAAGSPYEQQTDGINWRHRPLSLTRMDSGGRLELGHDEISVAADLPWQRGPAPLVIEKGAPMTGRALCGDCPPVGYPTDETRCLACPRRPAWRDASVLNSPYEQQTDGERWRHRRVISPDPTTGLHVGEDWAEGPAPDTPRKLTLADFAGATLTHAAHLDGPKGKDGWFGDIFRCVEHPRLARIDRCIRATRTVESRWMVDGLEGPESATLEEAIERLNTPPQLTAEETVVLKLVTWEYQDLRGSTRNLGIAPLMGLRDKGVIEFAEGKCRLRRNALFVPCGGAPGG